MSLSDADIERLAAILEDNRSPGRKHPLQADKPNESFCPVCNARVTKTAKYGEVGHRKDSNFVCPLRALRYEPERDTQADTQVDEYQDTLTV